MANIVFAEEQGSFLVGVAAALQSESGQLGFVGGVPNELIKKFEAGFVAGAQCVNPDAEVLVEYISDDPTIGFNDPARGREIAAAMYENGAEIVYGAAGASTPGVLEATAAAGEPGEVWTIGVDSDLYEQVDADLQPYVLTSMIKRVDNAVYNTIEREVNGEFAAGRRDVRPQRRRRRLLDVGRLHRRLRADDRSPQGDDHRRHDCRAHRCGGVTAPP